MQLVGRLVSLLVIGELACRFKVRCFLLGYGVIYKLAPFLLQHDQLLELHEEVVYIDCYHQRLKEELEAMPGTSSEVDLE